MPICRDEEGKVKYPELIHSDVNKQRQGNQVKYTEINYCRCQYA